MLRMIFRACDETLSATSEDTIYLPCGPVQYSQTAQVDQWCQSILDEPLTPESLDQMTDCPELSPDMSQDNMDSSLVDYLEDAFSIAGYSDNKWPSESMAERRTGHSNAFPYQDYILRPERILSDASAQDIATRGSVVDSPVLSQMSQNSHHPSFFHSPDFYLQAGSHVTQPIVSDQWTPPEGLQSSLDFQDGSLSFANGYTYGAHDQFYSASQFSGCTPFQPAICSQGGQMPAIGRTMSESQTTLDRPLLPRTQDPLHLEPQVRPQYRAIQALPAASNRRDSAATVSVATIPSTALLTARSMSEASSTQNLVSSREVNVPYSHEMPVSHQESFPAIRPNAPAVPNLAYYWNPLVYRQADQTDPPSSSHTSEYKVMTPGLRLASRNVQPAGTLVDTSYNMHDESRCRTDKLYKVTANLKDGLYYCPFASGGTLGESCKHKPTKLKCNYDKYIDSHLKPFRCKVEGCKGQHFSSTACLLRHEREAHGAHGHGTRPFSCIYEGCDRSINGFPRKYNLHDHMKRVHGWKDPEDSSHSSQRKNAGRRRKAASPELDKPASRRQKV